MFRMLLPVAFAVLVGCNKTDPQKPNADVGDKPAKKKSAYDERLASFKDAIEKGRVSEVKELIKAGADVNDKDDQGQTPLMWAAAKGHRAVMWVLLAGGAIPTERDSQGRTALLLAAEANQPDVVSLLLSPNTALQNAGELIAQIGLNPKMSLTASQLDERDRLGQTALLKAAKAGAEPVVTILITYPHNRRDDLRDIDGRTALMLAARGGHREIVEKLLALQADVKESIAYATQKDREGKTAAEQAAAHKDVVALLTDYVQDPEATDEQGQTPLMKAIQRGDRNAIDSLLRRNVSIRAADKNGKTAAILAAEQGDSVTLRSVAFQAYTNYDGVARNLNIADKDGRTPLMIAAERDDTASIVALIQQGHEIFGRTGFGDMVVSINQAKDKDGRTALMHAAAKGKEAAVFAILRAYGENERADLPGPTRRKQLLDRTDAMGKTALKLATEGRHDGVVEILKKNGATK